MKYKDFYDCLTVKVGTNAYIGPSITIKLTDNSIYLSKIINNSEFEPFRYVIFPLKIYGENIQHLNIIILDRKTKIIERFEPFNYYLNYYQINDLLEPLLYKLMENKKLYFLKYQSTLNTENILNDKNCGYYCIKYVVDKLKF